MTTVQKSKVCRSFFGIAAAIRQGSLVAGSAGRSRSQLRDALCAACSVRCAQQRDAIEMKIVASPSMSNFIADALSP